MNLTAYLTVSAALACMGMLGLLMHRKNLIFMLMCVELMLLGASTQFVALAHFLQDTLGAVIVFFILTVAAAEAAIGLAILVVLFRRHASLEVQVMEELKG